MMRMLGAAAVLLAALLALAGCDKIDHKALPGYTVRLNLGDIARWNTYGVSGVGEYRMFNRSKRLPANFPYDVNTYTGFGGVLLIMGLDISSSTYAPVAFDAACPVEKSADVAVTVDAYNFDAVCPKCGSHFDVLTGAGGPKSGQALTRKVGLTAYKVRATTNGGYVITSY